ncbi:protein of unknown function [Methylacidimicrobium sp. AP8]|uniref:hypothetical protein n=1 Tax=Methylacidimicrobium sp. AP8 TaxID=2730359 RepID=UPI0018C0D4B6|nr:hypothetical protein [Methylacidimicrobium sp. AP8]CAB4242497.1 protein of unknown function [Methylacidimicrobium sp. AP8]
MIVLLAELFLDGRLSTRPEQVPFLVERLCGNRSAGRAGEVWTPWEPPAQATGLRIRRVPEGELGRWLESKSGSTAIWLLGDARWNRAALESGRVEEIRIRWLPAIDDGGAEPFVSGFSPLEGAFRLRLRLIRWRKAKEGGVVARYTVGLQGRPGGTGGA